jgi:hypothetical protein
MSPRSINITTTTTKPTSQSSHRATFVDDISPSPTEAEICDFLAIPPYSAQQIQCILWLSWTTTRPAADIAIMHNKAFGPFAPQMTRWDVANIENDVTNYWTRQGGSFSTWQRMSLLAPPGDSNPWSCLCDFRAERCWEHKRDFESQENLEKLSMARTLWDATPAQMVRCPHGRGKSDREAAAAEHDAQPELWGLLFPAAKRECAAALANGRPRLYWTAFKLAVWVGFYFVVANAYQEGAYPGEGFNRLEFLLYAGGIWIFRPLIGTEPTMALLGMISVNFGVANVYVSKRSVYNRAAFASCWAVLFWVRKFLESGLIKVLVLYFVLCSSLVVAWSTLKGGLDMEKLPQWGAWGLPFWLLSILDFPTVFGYMA